MPFPFKQDDDDDGEERDGILQSLGDEVDDYAGDQLGDDAKSAGVTIEISIKPHGQANEGKEEEAPVEGDEEGHDPVAHALGMCDGGCAGE